MAERTRAESNSAGIATVRCRGTGRVADAASLPPFDQLDLRCGSRRCTCAVPACWSWLKSHALDSLVPGVRLPSAQLANGRLVVCGAFEAVYWTRASHLTRSSCRSLPPQPEGAGRELWLEGAISALARDALRERGWDLHEVPNVPVAGILQQPSK